MQKNGKKYCPFQQNNREKRKNVYNTSAISFEFLASFAILCEKAGPKGCIIIIRKSHRTSKSFRRNDNEKDIKNINSLKDLENLKDLNISIKDGDSKIEINTKNKQFQFSRLPK